MELQVTLTLSDRLFELLEDKLPNLGRRVKRAVTKEIGAQVRDNSEVSITVKPAPSGEPAKNPAAVPEAVAKAETAAKAKARDLGVEIRETMHRTRQRFIGEDYKQNTGSENYKKYYSPLRAQFIQIATALGYERPSAIDDPEKADQFAAECDALIIDEKGFITAPPAPF